MLLKQQSFRKQPKKSNIQTLLFHSYHIRNFIQVNFNLKKIASCLGMFFFQNYPL